ncbi:MAG TPA: CopG family transcriptional regulator [Chthoniobacterales bacterium]
MQREYYRPYMTTISLKVPDILDTRLAEEAQRRRTSKSAVVRDCVEKMLLKPHKGGAGSCLDLAEDLAGCLTGPRDIATNPEYLDDFGQ